MPEFRGGSMLNFRQENRVCTDIESATNGPPLTDLYCYFGHQKCCTEYLFINPFWLICIYVCMYVCVDR